MIRVGLCVHRSLHPETLASLWPLAAAGAGLAIQKSADVAWSRSKIAMGLTEDFLLFVDEDMVFAPPDVEKLLKALDNQPKTGAVAAYYVKWDGSRLPVCNWKKDDGSWYSNEERVKKAERYAKRGEVAAVQSFGAGLLAISREALSAVPHPAFETRWVNGVFEGEDTSFCQRLAEAGYRPSVHFGCQVGHIGPTEWRP